MIVLKKRSALLLHRYLPNCAVSCPAPGSGFGIMLVKISCFSCSAALMALSPFVLFKSDRNPIPAHWRVAEESSHPQSESSRFLPQGTFAPVQYPPALRRSRHAASGYNYIIASLFLCLCQIHPDPLLFDIFSNAPRHFPGSTRQTGNRFRFVVRPLSQF